MKLMATIILLGLPVLCGACATPSLPLSTRTEAHPVAATYNQQGMERYQQGQWLAASWLELYFAGPSFRRTAR